MQSGLPYGYFSQSNIIIRGDVAKWELSVHHYTLERVYEKELELYNLTLYIMIYLKLLAIEVNYLLQIDISLDYLLQCVTRK